MRTVTVRWGKCDEIHFGRFQLEPPVGYPSGHAQEQVALRIWDARDGLGMGFNMPFPQNHVRFLFSSFLSRSGPHRHC